MSSGADEIIRLYERHAEAWDRNRLADLVIERAWMERFVALLPPGGAVLDLGCGSGQPMARHLLERGFAVVGVDSSPTLIAKWVPGARSCGRRSQVRGAHCVARAIRASGADQPAARVCVKRGAGALAGNAATEPIHT